jgi:hypothetical protein
MALLDAQVAGYISARATKVATGTINPRPVVHNWRVWLKLYHYGHTT